MLLIITTSMLIMLLTLIILMLSLSLSKKSILDREKNSPFECGFDPKSSARLPFSLRFFLIAVIFLIFDVEIALIMPAMIIQNTSNSYTWMMTMTFFIVILLLGLYHEWNQGALQWAE
uniref:NADH-ubiquinone oxidoreductase chain 3 n=1 Tax=Loxoblemmus doenitzi TaxID=209185 RepID=A0A1J0M4D9_9ORTH|nr:NADH dehydrogenase subunit 3 [Loxoblemmus doenitzi]APD14909.1 NADH dehydrogenase subunit 3 [Loxoblemmus doenitzi]AQM39934.1 NADH dehydrogenase subunit 3 [Loxoblemmus doenitzi]QOL00666.1 NADH dehydrogenase subunit 3 [Loxoblemmus doenitzi]